MTTTAREPIIQAFLALLGTVSGLTLYRTQDSALARGELPALIVQPEEEQVEFKAAGIAMRKLTLLMTLLVRAEPPDQAADPWLQQIHALIMQDPTIGGVVGRTIERDTKWNYEMADLTGVAVEIRYEVTYATAANSLSARY